jgi:hypothetical protein
VNAPTRPLAGLCECIEKSLSVGVVPKDLLPSISTVEDMINRAGKLDAQFPWHGSPLPRLPPDVNMHGLTQD